MKDETAEAFEVLIIGGGPAGLSAALILGRCCRRVCLIDAGQPRNIRSRALHGFLSRDGMPPAEFLELARGDVRKYPNVKWRNMEAVACNSLDHRFRVRLADDASVAGQLLLLATGVVDRIPPLEGIMDFYGAT